VIGVPKRQHVLDRRGNVEVLDTLQVRWTFDERINDGMYAGMAMRAVQKVVEDPTRPLGAPEDNADVVGHADAGIVPPCPAAMQ